MGFKKSLTENGYCKRDRDSGRLGYMSNTNSPISLIVETAAKKKGGLSELSRELIRRDIKTSYQQLSSAVRGLTRSVDSIVLLECLEIGFDGDWNKARKAIRK